MRDVFICDAIRTPIGRFGGALAPVRVDDLAALPISSLLKRSPNLDPALIDEIMLGCANQAGEDNRNVARMAGLLAGVPVSVPGVTYNRLCASGLEAVGGAFRAIASGEMELIVAGGVESMSRAPFVLGKSESAFSRAIMLEDTTIGWRFVNPKMKATHGVDTMPQTADLVANKYEVSRADQDAFALQSQTRAAHAQRIGYFSEEIVPVTISLKKGIVVVEHDEHIRSDTTLDKLASLSPINGPGNTVTAGNSSGVNDGAAAMLIASDAAVKRSGLTARARILGMASAGLEPREMGYGPVPAIERLLSRLGMSISDFQVIEINEAFASQSLAVARALGLEDTASHLNANGGAIALGHPLGMSGARLAMTAVHQLQQSGGKFALVALCVGVGQGLAMAIEAV